MENKEADVSDCLFCKMVSGEIKADIVHEDDLVLAFRDINPQAPTHVLVIPKKHVSTMNELQAEDEAVVGRMLLTAKKVAEMDGVSESGYRTVMNCNEAAGQSVFHIHLHVMAGRRFSWPPG